MTRTSSLMRSSSDKLFDQAFSDARLRRLQVTGGDHFGVDEVLDRTAGEIPNVFARKNHGLRSGYRIGPQVYTGAHWIVLSEQTARRRRCTSATTVTLSIAHCHRPLITATVHCMSLIGRCGQHLVLIHSSASRSRSTGRPFTRCSCTISAASSGFTWPYQTASG